METTPSKIDWEETALQFTVQMLAVLIALLLAERLSR